MCHTLLQYYIHCDHADVSFFHCYSHALDSDESEWAQAAVKPTHPNYCQSPPARSRHVDHDSPQIPAQWRDHTSPQSIAHSYYRLCPRCLRDRSRKEKGRGTRTRDYPTPGLSSDANMTMPMSHGSTAVAGFGVQAWQNYAADSSRQREENTPTTEVQEIRVSSDMDDEPDADSDNDAWEASFAAEQQTDYVPPTMIALPAPAGAATAQISQREVERRERNRRRYEMVLQTEREIFPQLDSPHMPMERSDRAETLRYIRSMTTHVQEDVAESRTDLTRYRLEMGDEMETDNEARHGGEDLGAAGEVNFGAVLSDSEIERHLETPRYRLAGSGREIPQQLETPIMEMLQQTLGSSSDVIVRGRIGVERNTDGTDAGNDGKFEFESGCSFIHSAEIHDAGIQAHAAETNDQREVLSLNCGLGGLSVFGGCLTNFTEPLPFICSDPTHFRTTPHSDRSSSLRESTQHGLHPLPRNCSKEALSTNTWEVLIHFDKCGHINGVMTEKLTYVDDDTVVARCGCSQFSKSLVAQRRARSRERCLVCRLKADRETQRYGQRRDPAKVQYCWVDKYVRRVKNQRTTALWPYGARDIGREPGV